jgi:hypothetical protein
MTALVYPTADELRTRRKRGRGTPADRLAACYVVDANGCWRWVKGRTSAGYGHFSIASVYFQAHRLLYILRFGADIPDGLEPDHLCRNRWCVNPDCLEPVTHSENMRRGIRTVLNPQSVVGIHAARARGLSMRAIGRLFGVDHSTVCRVLKGERWPEYVPSPAEAVA